MSVKLKRFGLHKYSNNEVVLSVKIYFILVFLRKIVKIKDISIDIVKKIS